jgi:hypothetical protein
MVTPSSIELHIEELVLHGLSGYDSVQLGEAVQREVVRLLQAQGLPAGLAAEATIGRLDAGSFTLAADARAASVGIGIAQAIYQNITK